MYLHTLKLWNFRKYGITGDNFESAEPGLKIEFNDNVNVLIGENDSGKTTIIDAIRYILRTQSLEYVQIDEKDFYQDKDTGLRRSELKIECTFKGFTNAEAGHFIEWLGFEGQDYVLKVWLYARNKDNSIYQFVRAGIDAEGAYLEGDARNLLRVVYLKPLRDALTEMTHGGKSRLAQILKAHDVFKRENNPDGTEKSHQLEDHYNTLKSTVDDYFNPETQNKGKIIVEKINELLTENFLIKDDRNATIKLTGSDLSDILKQLDLILESNKSGLGSLNLLCIAAELLLFNEVKQGLKLTLIEELEVHLHPQYQLRLIDYINEKQDIGQFILTTHSTTLASKIKLENLIICKNEYAFPMGHKHTQLNESDYRFLERFLDATKANLFFAKGVIIVEGDAENLLVPTIAKLIDRPLHKYGVSIVNVGSAAFKRYAKIFLRKELPDLDIPVSIISDLDIRSYEYYTEQNASESSEETDLPQIVVVDDDFRREITKITQDINLDNLPLFFTFKKDFKNYISINKTVSKFPSKKAGEKSIGDKLDDVFNTFMTDITVEMITQLREEKKNRLISEWQDQKVKLFLTANWTLEYEIASSRLYRYLAQAIQISKSELSNSNIIIDNEFLDKVYSQVLHVTPDEVLTDPMHRYKIFEPLCTGNTSKASTAQYLAEILELSNNESAITNIIKTDLYLKYLCDAIYHVTEQPKQEDKHE